VLTVDEGRADAPAAICFRVAADVESWPTILPHYRWVRFRRKDGFGAGEVEMAAWRRFGPLPYPTWWVSEMTSRPDDLRVFYEHIDGITRGMRVEWSVHPDGEGGCTLKIVHEWDGPGWPLIGDVAANRVIGPHFIHHVASRTLAGVAREAERLARHV
jgi:ribosome-associated toxin RatA of RatAB toxin-antitoxin module